MDDQLIQLMRLLLDAGDFGVSILLFIVIMRLIPLIQDCIDDNAG